MKILVMLIKRYMHTVHMVNFATKFMKYLFTVLYEIEKNESGLVDKSKSPINERILRSNSVVIMNNTLFPGRGVKCQFDPMFDYSNTKLIKRNALIKIVITLLNIENLQIKERGVVIIRVMMNKLKFKYSLKPKWLERIKQIIRKDNIPQISMSLNNIHGVSELPIVLRKNPNNLKLNNKTLDEYLVEDVV